jgi:hypothetical protein
MFRAIKYIKPGLSPGKKGIISLRDTCFGELRFKRMAAYDIPTNYIYYVVKAYSDKHLNIITNLARCLLFMRREYETNISLAVILAEPVINKLSPSVNFAKYLPLVKKIYIPQIMRIR